MKKLKEHEKQYEEARIAGLEKIGCKPANHPAWMTAFDHQATFARFHQGHKEILKKYTEMSA